MKSQRECLRNRWQTGPYKQRALPHLFHWSRLHQRVSSTNSQVMAVWLHDATVGSQIGTLNSKNSYVIYMIRLASEEIKKILKPWEIRKSVLEHNSKECQPSLCSETFINRDVIIPWFFGKIIANLYTKTSFKKTFAIRGIWKKTLFHLYYYKDE